MITASFKHFIKGITFNIKLVSPNNAKSYDNITIANKLVYDYYKKKDSNYDIYFRPETTKFILLDLDDLSTTQLKQTLAQLQINKHKCSFLIQTSKNNYKAWFYCPQSTDWETYKPIAKHLANKFGGDLKSFKAKQVGRLPPYTANSHGGYGCT